MEYFIVVIKIELSSRCLQRRYSILQLALSISVNVLKCVYELRSEENHDKQYHFKQKSLKENLYQVAHDWQ